MTYYLLLDGDSEKDSIYETNVLGEESFETFYPSVGFMILNRILNQQPELIESIKIIDEHKNLEYEKSKNNIEAVVFENKIDFRTEPNYRSDILFNLHEGTKVLVKEELNEWTLIQILDGNTGWIESQSI